MATIMELEKNAAALAEQQARELHNARIQECYRRLQNAESSQFMQETTNIANTDSVRASVLAPEKPVYSTPSVQETPIVEQVPQITEYVREKIENPVFTTEKFQSAQQTPVMETAAAPVMEIAVAPVTHTASAVAAEPQYSLSRAAKIAMAAFGTTVALMLTFIGINSGIIRQKTEQLNALERGNQELRMQNAELEERLQIAKSEDSIREYALSQGMIQG